MKNSDNPRVLLIAPPVFDFALFDLFLKPYGLLKIGKNLELAGYEVSLLNCLDHTEPLSRERLGKPRRRKNGTGKFFRRTVEKPAFFSRVPRLRGRYGILEEVIQARIKEAAPDLVLVTGIMTYWYEGVREVCGFSKALFPRVPVVLGGVYPTLCPDHAREVMDADFILQGEAWPGLNGILEKLGLPLMNRWVDDLWWEGNIFSQAAVLRLNQGCPYSCAYCSSRAVSGVFRQGDPLAVFDQLKRIHSREGCRNFAFYDDALLIRKESVLIPFLEAVVSSGIKVDFYLPNAIHLAYIDEELAALMFRAGFKELRIGFESARAGFHQEQDGKLKVEDFGEKLRILLAAGFTPDQIAPNILAGLPAQPREEVEETIRFAATFGVNVHISEYSPVPGSAMWEASVAHSSYPLATEPLTHNNSVFPMEWEGFTLEDMKELKLLGLELCRHRNV